jgi:hypothetical protein
MASSDPVCVFALCMDHRLGRQCSLGNSVSINVECARRLRHGLKYHCFLSREFHC